MDLSNTSQRLGLAVALIIIIGGLYALFMNKDTSPQTEKTDSAAYSDGKAPTADTKTTSAPPSAAASATTTTHAVIKTNMGTIEVELFAADAPKTVENFVKLSKAGFYDATKFHRVIKNFMIQAGDPFSKDDSQMARWGTGGPGYVFDDEINSHKLVRGVLAMANAGPGTNGSQFLLVTAQATPWLDGHHTVFGKVVKGMDIVDVISNIPTGPNDIPKSPIIVESITTK